MESPEIIILEESPPPSPPRPPSRASSEEDEEMLENTSLSLSSQVILLKSIINAKQEEIDKLTDNLENEKRLRKKVEGKYDKLKGEFAQIAGEIGGIVEDLQGKKEEKVEDDTVKRELDQLSDNLQKRLDKSEENTVVIREEIEELNKQLDNFIQVHLPLPKNISNEVDSDIRPQQPENVVGAASTTESQPATPPPPAPLPAKRVSIKPVRLMEELTIQQNQKKVQVRKQATPPKKKGTCNHAIDTSRNNQKTFYCVCGRRFCSSSKVREHVKYHTKEWKFRCDLCSWKCAGANYLRQHYQLVHKMKMASKFGCRECGGMLDTWRDLLKHQAIMHKTPKPSNAVNVTTGQNNEEVSVTDFGDDIQEIPITTSTAMGNEQRRPTPIPPPHPTPTAQLQQNQLVSKIGYDGRSHGKGVSKGDSRFYCICGKGYNHAPTLLHHIKYQTWQWRFRCSECGLLFYGANYLRKHMVSTHKVVPGAYVPTFGCRRCGKLYKQYSQLVLHQRTAHRTRARDPLE